MNRYGGVTNSKQTRVRRASPRPLQGRAVALNGHCGKDDWRYGRSKGVVRIGIAIERIAQVEYSPRGQNDRVPIGGANFAVGGDNEVRTGRVNGQPLHAVGG